ncbi:MAG: CHAT domain-containing protein [Coleofasciculus sp. C1-SOL-03]|jgi:CHAT domain-containing protein/Tfp pilus assembly protein PilF|uniref:CHAT domain-containing protein n=1 Tax=Coleofasciculus sp. C1-SOL-03 TaxID=3069522 RepID=UPI0032F238D6
MAQSEADRLLDLGLEQYKQSHFQVALRYWQQALTLYQEIANSLEDGVTARQGEGNTLNYLGKAYHCLSEYQKAIECHQQSLGIAQEIGDSFGDRFASRIIEGNALNGLGKAYYCLDEYQKAIDYHQQSLEIFQTISDSLGDSLASRQGKSDSLNNLGNTYQSLGNYPRAIECHQQSLAIRQEIGDRFAVGISLNNLGNVYYSQGDYHKAIEYYQQSLAIAREIGDRCGEGCYLGNLGSAYKFLEDYHKAIDYHQQSLRIKQEIGDRNGQGISLHNLGNAYFSLGDYSRAIDYQQQSLATAQEISDRLGEWLSLNDLGKVFLKTNQLVDAEEKLRAALEICETLRSSLVNSDHQVSLFETQVNTYRLLQQVLVAQDNYDIALEIAEQGRTRIFVELLRERSSKPDEVMEIANQGSAATSKRAVQIAQEKNATIVEYSIVEDDIYCWVISPTGNITFRRANLNPLQAQHKTLNDLNDIFLKARVSIGVDERDQQGKKIQCESNELIDAQGRYPLLQLLYQILISPITDLLPPDPHTPLIIIPHYGLFLVPFSALQDANNRYFIEQHTLLTAPSIEILELTHQRQQSLSRVNQSALVVGDPTIDAQFTQPPYNLKPIPAAKEAAEAIATLLQTQAITGKMATKARILNPMKTASLIHISAHGLLDDFHDSGIPGTIILAPDNTDNGALNAAEILSLTLNAEFVVLSACSTGKGEITGDGIIGLSRCFILAGVPSLIVSLWDMGAYSAKRIMIEFYQNLAQGDDKATALRQAILKAKEDFPPADWAAFTLIGETAPLSLCTPTPEPRRRTMAFPSESTPQEIRDAFFNLLETSNLFSDHLPSLDQVIAQPTDTPQDIAQRIEKWCESRPTIQANMENKLSKMGAGGTDSQPDAEIAAEFNQRLEKNRIRLGSPPASSMNQTEI